MIKSRRKLVNEYIFYLQSINRRVDKTLNQGRVQIYY